MIIKSDGFVEYKESIFIITTRDHSKWDQIRSVKIAKYIVYSFCVYRWSYLIWSPVILSFML